ncbi:MAG: TolC family protein [Rikenellaceae bacterium]
MRLHNNIFFALVAVLSSATIGVEAKPLTLAECREMAIESNLTLKSSIESVDISKDLLASYRSNHLPNLSLNANYLYSTTTLSQSIEGGYLPTLDISTGAMIPNQYAYMPDMNFDFEVGSIYNVGAMVVQPIYIGGKVSSAVKLAEIGVSVSQSRRQLTEAEVIVATDEAFYTLLKVEEMVTTAHKYQEVVEEFYRQTKNAQEAGMCRLYEVMKVEVRLNEAKLMCQRAENGRRLAKMNLCYAIGLPLATLDLEVQDEFELGRSVDSSNLDITGRPEYRMLEQQIEAKELEVKLTRSDYLPSISAIANYGYTGGAKLNNQTLFNSANFTGGVMVSVPIFNWGEGRRKSSAQRREVTIAQNQFEDLSQQMTLELMQAINNYDEATMEVLLNERSVRQAEENMRLSGEHYGAGMESIADYLEAQMLWQEAMNRLVEARGAQRIAFSLYEKAAGY